MGRRCQHDGCNLPSERKGLYCATHKLNDIMNKSIQLNGCNKITMFHLANIEKSVFP